MSFACYSQYCQYEDVASGYGGQGIQVDRSNEDKLKEILQEAQKQSKAGNSYLINCLIGKTSFREGSISV
jgi:acetolactate synthase-like protein